MKKLLSFIIVLCMIIVSVPMSASAASVCTPYKGKNLEAQNYSRWASTVNSYLSKTSDGKIMKVQAGGDIPGVLVEYYDTEYNLVGSKVVKMDASIFGGFYESNSNYFLVTGNQNPNKQKDVMVICVTKYDKNWNRIDSVGAYDVNTTVPFDVGSLRMTMCNNILFIHTSHATYETINGVNNQENMTFSVDTNNMTIIKCKSDRSNISEGDVSHSFNQFVKMDGKNLITVDHGDAYPRSIVLIKHPNASDGLFGINCEETEVLKFAGELGYNDTGASIGGFEISSSSYLIAGNTVEQNDNFYYNKTRNVFVASVTASGTKINKITKYTEGETTASTPHFVKIANDEYMLLWSRNNKVYYTTIDKNGDQTSNIYNMTGNLSDCAPTVINNKLVWYVWNGTKSTFYEIDINSTSLSSNAVTVDSAHEFDFLGINNGLSTVRCKKCQETTSVPVPENMMLWWELGSTFTGDSYNSIMPELKMGDTLENMIVLTPSDARTNKDIDVIIEDETILSYKQTYVYNDYGMIIGTFTPLKGGQTNVTFQHRYNPKISVTVPIEVKQDPTSVKFENSTISMKVGDMCNLTPILTPDNASTTYKWSNSDKSVADFYDEGILIAQNIGTTVITVTTANGLTASCTVKVINPVKGDVNGDFEITVKDAILVLQYNINKVSLSEAQLECADIDGSGSIDVIDAILIQKLILEQG